MDLRCEISYFIASNLLALILCIDAIRRYLAYRREAKAEDRSIEIRRTKEREQAAKAVADQSRYHKDESPYR